MAKKDETQKLAPLPTIGIMAIVIGLLCAYSVYVLKGMILFQVLLGAVSVAGVAGGVILLILAVVFYIDENYG